MNKLAIAVYGTLAYLGFLGVFVYLIGFLGNFGVPKSVDSGPTGPVAEALLVNTLLILLFGAQHSVMARPAFKQSLTRIVPEAIERSTYVWFTNAALIVLFVLWQPIDAIVWNVETPALRTTLWSVFAIGFGIVVFSTLLINHFDLFGLRQIWFRVRDIEYRPLVFRTPLLYHSVRHPIYLGFTLAFFSTPTLSLGHLLFAVGMLAYMRIAIGFEESDLIAAHSEYAEYRQRVPMLIPRFGRRALATPAAVRVRPNS